MKMEKNKIKFSFNKENFNLKKIKSLVFDFFVEHSELVFMSFFIGISLYSGFLIYHYIYFSAWSQDRQDAYLQEIKKNEIDFKLKDFNLVIDKIKQREAAYNSEQSGTEMRDIFGVKK